MHHHLQTTCRVLSTHLLQTMCLALGAREDPEDPADVGDDDESSDEDNDNDEEEQEEQEASEDDDKEEEHSSLADSSAIPVDGHVPSTEDTEAFETDESAPTPVPSPRRRMTRMSIQPQTPMSATVEALIADAARHPVLDVATMDATPGRLVSKEVGYRIEDVWDDMVRDMEERAPTTVEGLSQRVIDLFTTLARDTHEIHAWGQAMDCNMAVHAELQAYRAQTSSLQTQLTTNLGRNQILEARDPACADNLEDKMPPKKRTATTTTTTPMTDAQIKAPISQGVAGALAEIEANRISRNGDDSHDSGTCSRRTERVAYECTYNNFLKCQPFNFKGTEGVIGLTQWFERIESVFHISNCAVENQIKFATCTLLGSALTWWNSHVKAVGHNAAYGLTWKSLMKIMFLEESDQVEKYVGGFPDIIQGSVMASKPKTMQEAIKIANDPMDQKICTLAERQAGNKRKFEDTSRNNQNQQRACCCQQLESQGASQRDLTCFEYGAQGHFKSNSPKLKNKNQGNQAGNGNVVVRAYAVGNVVTNLNPNVVTVVDYDEEYQEKLQGDSQEDKLTTAMMLLAREITQKFSTPTNNHLCISSNTRNQAVVQDGRVDIQTKNAGYGGNANKNAGRQNRNQVFNAGNRSDDSNQIVQRKPKVRDAKYLREQMLLAMKDEAGSNLTNEENDFMLDTSYGEDTLEELTAAIMLMARLQPADENVPSYDAKAVSEVNASSKVHEQVSHVKCKTIIQTMDDDQIDSCIIFDDPFVENNGGMYGHDSSAHNEYHDIKMLAYNVQREVENQKRLNDELRKQIFLPQQELETCQSIQTIHMLGKKPNKVYDSFLKAGLGYQNPERLKKVIVAQPKLYNGDSLRSANVITDSPDSEETLEDAKESQLKMRNKMVQINYSRLNVLYETFVPQQEFYAKQIYFLIPSTSNNGSESIEVTLELPNLKMPKESRLLKRFDTMGVEIKGLQTRIDKTLLEDRERRWMSDSQNSLREFYNSDVISMSNSLYKRLKEIKEELIEKVQEMLNNFESIEKRVAEKPPKETILENEIDQLLEVSLTSEIRDCVLLSVEQQKNKLLKDELEKSLSDSKDIQANLLKRIKILKNDFKRSQAQSVESSNSVRRPTSSDTKSNNRVLKNTKSSSTYVWKTSSSASIDSNKCEPKDSNVCQTNACVSNSKTVNAYINAVNDGSN
uniref:Reverse transcriptase domain-containing protein n=1 Tax=Tanacetum cinerariifolium TaxID=118510 RepID=A0A6L2KVF0_TANCI|nr:hypothetical protein [Tanacetum cinerariifolium]